MTDTARIVQVFDRGLVGFLLVLFLSFVAITVWIQLDPLDQFAHSRDQYRQQQLELVAVSLSKLPTATTIAALEKLTADNAVQFQIGTAETGCQLTTDYCQITTDTCAIPSFLPKEADQVLSDVLHGSPTMTGVVLMQHEGRYFLRSCYGETRLVEAELSFSNATDAGQLNQEKL